MCKIFLVTGNGSYLQAFNSLIWCYLGLCCVEVLSVQLLESSACIIKVEAIPLRFSAFSVHGYPILCIQRLVQLLVFIHYWKCINNMYIYLSCTYLSCLWLRYMFNMYMYIKYMFKRYFGNFDLIYSRYFFFHFFQLLVYINYSLKCHFYKNRCMTATFWKHILFFDCIQKHAWIHVLPHMIHVLELIITLIIGISNANLLLIAKRLYLSLAHMSLWYLIIGVRCIYKSIVLSICILKYTACVHIVYIY